MTEYREKDETVSSSEETSIEKLLRDREKLDEELKSRFSQDVTVMFTDIKGSTNFFETYGDIEGRLMVQKHNEMLFPVIEKHAGKVIKTIGDAIMASFKNPVEAVRAATLMQNRLLAYNKKKKDKKDQIHIRIGINKGEGLVEEKDIYGDVVNVAARVESLCAPDEILISGAVYEDVRKTDDIICRYAQQTKVRGKEDAIEVYRVIWTDEASISGLTRGMPAEKLPEKRRALRKRLEIDISCEEETIKVTATEKFGRAESTMRQYEEMKVSFSNVQERCQEILSLLNRANTRGKVSKEILTKLRDVGLVLFDELLTARAKEVLRGAQVEDLVFYLDEGLVQIPWELLYDGEQFLCQKFNMGRIVKTKRSISNVKHRMLSRPLKMLIISDPRGDLENAGKEGRAIREKLDTAVSLISANQRTGQIRAEYITEKIRNFDIVHYAGHADYDDDDPSKSGWLLEGGKLTSADIVKLAGGRPMPALVFCNACKSGQTEGWQIGPAYGKEIFGLANAFLLTGVQHYIGTFWEILDEPSAQFAHDFYAALLDGESVGEAIRHARLSLIKHYGEDTIVWSSYMLYGDPAFDYFEFAGEYAGEDAAEAEKERLTQAGGLRSPISDTVTFDAQQKKRMNIPLVAGVGLAVVIAVMALVFALKPDRTAEDPYLLAYRMLKTDQVENARQAFEAFPASDPRRYEGLAAVFFETGQYDKSLEMTEKTVELAPQNIYANVLKGHILFSQGRTEEAFDLYQKATEVRGGINWQKGEAFNAMARIASEKGNADKALEYYAQAAAFYPESAEIQANYGVLLQRTGNRSGALTSFQKASESNPGDYYAAVFLAQAERQKQLEADKARQERIDSLISDLSEQFRTGAVVEREETWDSTPVAISFIDFSARGTPSMREGESDFFVFKLNAMLQDENRINVVEREMLDKLLAELKLSSSELADPNTALRLGRILAANIIATGALMRYGEDVQVSLRLVDTETTALKGAIAESGKDLNALSEEVYSRILDRINREYPLRATVSSVDADRIELTLGGASGVREEMMFRLFQEGKSPADGRTVLVDAGSVVIISVEPHRAFAKVVDSPVEIEAGTKVEQMVN